MRDGVPRRPLGDVGGGPRPGRNRGRASDSLPPRGHGAPSPHGRIDGRKLSHAASEVIRRMAVREVAAGAAPSAVMAKFGLCRTSIYRWLRRARADGVGALSMRPHPGRRPQIDVRGAELVRATVVGRSPEDLGIDGALWTREAVAALVLGRLGLTLSVVGAGRLLTRIGLNPRAVRPTTGSPDCVVVFAFDPRGRFRCAECAPSEIRSTMSTLAAVVGRPVSFSYSSYD